jgi:hypothetical protein
MVPRQTPREGKDSEQLQHGTPQKKIALRPTNKAETSKGACDAKQSVTRKCAG